MGLNLYMIGLMTQNMDKSLEFYRLLGLDIPAESAGQSHVEVKMNGELTFFLNTAERIEELRNTRIILEFYLKERSVVDAKYAELTNRGYQSQHAPFTASIGMYFALINDPDGNTVLLSAN